ncbi:hypothetical protein [Qipengyuania sp.]|uniref:hypothetical protein n=1 Tax=Qipengyuania sp. TaxID=2004515 RepID=UPI0035C83D27
MTLNPFSILTSKIYGAIAIVALAGMAAQTVRIEGLGPIDGFKDRIAELVEDVAEVTAQRDAEAQAHRLTKQTYRQAQVEAAALERQRIARVMAQQKEATDAILESHARDLGALRARADGLRRQLAQGGSAAPGPGGGGEMPGLAGGAGGAADTARYPRLPRSDAEQLARDVIATEQALQLEALIAWTRAQSAIDPNTN